MKYRPLGKTGVNVSVLGFGAATLGDLYGAVDPAECSRAVHAAIDLGINYFDVSPFYGLTLAEKRLGEALSGKRDRVFLATKCGRYNFTEFDFSEKRLLKSIDESLARLRTDHVDLLQAHDIEFGSYDQIVNETIPALRKIQQSGKARFVGITAYPPETLCRVAAAAPVDTVLTYCRYNLMVRDLDDQLTPFARREGIGLVNSSPFHMGVLTEAGTQVWHPASSAVKEAGAGIVALCRERGTSVARVALRFCLDHPYAATTLTGMSSVAQVKENAGVVDQPADPDLMEDIERLVAPVLNRTWASGDPGDIPEKARLGQ